MAYGQDTSISSVAGPCSQAGISSRASHNPAVLGGQLLPRMPHPPGTPSQDHPGSPAVPEPSLNPKGWPPSHLRGGPRTEIRPCPPGCDPITPGKGKLVVWKEMVQNEGGEDQTGCAGGTVRSWPGSCGDWLLSHRHQGTGCSPPQSSRDFRVGVGKSPQSTRPNQTMVFQNSL